MITIWELLNEPFAILLIGSGLGWLFLKFVWEPYQARKTRNERAAMQRTEVEVRLTDILYRLRKAYSTYPAVNGSRTYNVFVAPELREASLFALIAGGWEPKVAQRYYKRIQALVLNVEQMKNTATRRQAEESLANVASDLGITLPAAD